MNYSNVVRLGKKVKKYREESAKDRREYKIGEKPGMRTFAPQPRSTSRKGVKSTRNKSSIHPPFFPIERERVREREREREREKQELID